MKLDLAVRPFPPGMWLHRWLVTARVEIQPAAALGPGLFIVGTLSSSAPANQVDLPDPLARTLEQPLARVYWPAAEIERLKKGSEAAGAAQRE